MRWIDSHDAYFAGFQDGARSIFDRVVESHHNHYERGFIFGLLERKRFMKFSDLRTKNLERCVLGFKHALESWSVAEWGNATAGECGEACNIAKKMLRYRDGVAGNEGTKTREDYRRQLATEIAGMVIYADLWAASEGIDLGVAVIEEFNKKSREIGSDIFI